MSSQSSLLDRIFDPEYRANINAATRKVPLLWFMYVLCIPLSKFLVKLRWSPTTITHISNLLAVASVISLAVGTNPWQFVVLWVAALFFDMADGTVARVTKRSSARGSFYDHMSDQVKVIALFLAAALRYDTVEIWILSYLVNAGFLFLGVVIHVSAVRSLRLSHRAPVAESASAATDVGRPTEVRVNRLKAVLVKSPALKRILGGIYVSIFAIYGNSMLLVLPLAFGEVWAIGTLGLFGIVVLRSLIIVVLQGARVSRELDTHGVSWK